MGILHLCINKLSYIDIIPSFLQFLSMAPRDKGSPMNSWPKRFERAGRLTNDLGLPSIVVTAFSRHHHLRYEEPAEVGVHNM